MENETSWGLNILLFEFQNRMTQRDKKEGRKNDVGMLSAILVMVQSYSNSFENCVPAITAENELFVTV
jgi:hypothetical protein